MMMMMMMMMMMVFVFVDGSTNTYRVQCKEPIAMTSESFVGVNIDSASLYQDTRLNFQDQNLILAARRLADEDKEHKMTLRIGGSAADDLMTFRNDSDFSIYLTEEYWDEIVDFVKSCNLNLAWDLNMRMGRTKNGSAMWDSQDAVRLLDHIAANSQEVWAFQVGNEPGHWETRNGGSPNALVHAEDFLTFRNILDKYYSNDSERPRIQGADVCKGKGTDTSPCANMTYFSDLVKRAGNVLDDITVHSYGLRGPKAGRPDECELKYFLSRKEFSSGVLRSVGQWQDDLPSNESIKLVLSETATAADGGCHNMSNRFVAGFYWIHMLGELGDAKLHQVYRQDLVGFSGINGGSSYALAGPPGWYDEKTQGITLTPNPDFFITALQRRLVGSKRFLVEGNDKVFHAACSKDVGIVLSFTNVNSSELEVDIDYDDNDDDDIVDDVTIEMYVFTAPNGNLTSDVMELNGDLVPASFDALLTPSILHTRSLVLPAYSYGFIVDRSVVVKSCM